MASEEKHSERTNPPGNDEVSDGEEFTVDPFIAFTMTPLTQNSFTKLRQGISGGELNLILAQRRYYNLEPTLLLF